ncbi:AAA family ATPase [Haloferula sp.]|uniref:AAA family ATPase n=1 Tax=Haloferula sp. TaxID=2497595 RepID=UPI003C734B40
MEMKACHVVCGPPASGKTHYARRIAAELGACLIDSDEVAERLVRAGLQLAKMNPDDRDSPAYKQAYREVVYETMYDVARSNLEVVPVVLAGPFTNEGGMYAWPEMLEARLGVMPELHFVWCRPGQRRLRMMKRGKPRDLPKLVDWEAYCETCREEAPVWRHHFVDTSSS